MVEMYERGEEDGMPTLEYNLGSSVVVNAGRL
jgi:hypothetical protein